MHIASQLDKLRSHGKVIGPLHGIPFLVKDNIASKDRMETTAGSWALQGSIVPRDAYVVSRLRGRLDFPLLDIDLKKEMHFRTSLSNLTSKANAAPSGWCPADG